eukprot:NODE_569_length_6602_cov_0.189143.p1 type:complete len:446 gc:universal NODE_569_length_6602_cov_0.189143:4376-5713(+)
MKWNREQQNILNLVKSGKSVFFSGPAGSGKSHLLKAIITELKFKFGDSNLIGVLSTTGISAINIGGITLHSFFRIGTGEDPVDVLIYKNRRNKNWINTRAIIIDEISMLDGQLFDKLEFMAQNIRGPNSGPFGGLQLIVCGDFYQLPPANKNSTYCFESSTWDSCITESVLLKKIYRQKSQAFVDILNEIRNDIAKPRTRALIISQKRVEFDVTDGIEPTCLFSSNIDVDFINNQKLNELIGETTTFQGKFNGNKLHVEHLIKNSRCPFKLKLKLNAQVMLLKNIDIENGLVNGLKGIVVDLKESLPLVLFENKSEPILVHPHKFEFTDPLTRRTKATYTQIPLTLCWACTIHKSQGSTISKLIVDCKGIFSYGQLYVALSRAQKWEQLKIVNFNPTHIKTDPKVVKFYERLNRLQSRQDVSSPNTVTKSSSNSLDPSDLKTNGN